MRSVIGHDVVHRWIFTWNYYYRAISVLIRRREIDFWKNSKMRRPTAIICKIDTRSAHPITIVYCQYVNFTQLFAFPLSLSLAAAFFTLRHIPNIPHIHESWRNIAGMLVLFVSVCYLPISPYSLHKHQHHSVHSVSTSIIRPMVCLTVCLYACALIIHPESGYSTMWSEIYIFILRRGHQICI